MRCDECKVEPLTPGHFCECCGRKLSIQERKASDDQKASRADNSWGEPAPVLPKPRKGDRLVGVHYAPEPYVDDVSEAPAPYADPVPEAETAPPPLDPVLEAHFAAHFGDAPAPAVPPAAHAAIEAHFAGQALVDAGPAVAVAAPVPVAPVSEPHSSAAPAEPVLADDPRTVVMHADGPAAHLDGGARSARCESCGGPAEDGDLCAACRQAFHALLDNTNPTLPAHVVADAAVPAREVAVAPVVTVAPEIPPAVSAAPAEIAAAPSAHAVAVGAAPAPSPVAPAGLTPAPVKSVIRLKAPPPSPDVAPVVSVDPVPQAKVPKPVAPVAAVAVRRAQRTSPVRTIAGAAAVIVVIAAIGLPLTNLWLGGQEGSPIIHEAPPAAKSREKPARATTPPGVPAPAATTARDESVVPAVPPARPKPVPVAPALSKAGAASSNTPRTAAARVPSPAGRQPVAPVRQAAAVSSLVAPAPAPDVAAPAPVAAAPASVPEPPPAPVGPFFELRDVNETPRVATRVEPQVPDDLRDRPLNEVVIVRVLVTQSGHPLMVNLLRKSRSGPSLDDAIVAAVKQWTFVPARKRGEAVSCWFHVAVPVSRAN